MEAGFQAGLYRMENGRYEEAVEAFSAYAEDETCGAGAQYNIGICRMNLGDISGPGCTPLWAIPSRANTRRWKASKAAKSP